jgi:hypothetical protein
MRTDGARVEPGRALRALVLAGAIVLAGACEESSAGPDGSDGDDGGAQTYHYVLIVDSNMDPSTVGGRAGLDIDAVELVSGSESVFAASVSECAFGSGDNSAASDCNRALGTPEATCNAAPASWVSLAGDGGYLIVSFEGLHEIRQGDLVRVHSCDPADGPYDVSVGVSTTATDPNWMRVMADATGTVEATVPALPVVPES